MDELIRNRNSTENHSRQMRLLKENEGVVLGLHATSIDNALKIEINGFEGTDSVPGGNDMLYKPETAVWFQEDTELDNCLLTAQTRFKEGFAVIKAKLNNPNIDPLWRPFWVVNQYQGKDSDRRIEILGITYYDQDGQIISVNNYTK